MKNLIRLNIMALLISALACAQLIQAMPQAAKEITVAEGTKVRLALQTPISSKLNEVGDQLSAILYDPLSIDGKLVLARGTEFQGRISQISPAGKGQKQSSMTIVFDKVIIPGVGEEPVSLALTSIDDYTNDTKHKADGEGKVKGGHDGSGTVGNTRSGAEIGGAGAFLVLLAGGPAAVAAGVLGAGLAGGVLLTKGKEIKLQPGTIFRASFNRPITLPVQQYTGNN